MNLGWSDGGYGELRASDADRDEVRRLLGVARAEGRLDGAEHERRAGAVRATKTRADLVRLTTDLPERKGVREWVDRMRVRGADRDDARRWLADAAAQGRLTDQEHGRRLAALSTVDTYDELKALVDGLPGRAGTARGERLAGTADREAAFEALAAAVADGRINPFEAPALEADIKQARRVGALDAVLAGLAARASDQDRQDVVAALAAAHRGGQLDAAEYADRADRAHDAVRDDDLVPLTADLLGDARRLAESDRQEAADALKRALDEGRLDLAEFDERVRAAHAATTTADVAPLLADLTTPPRPARRHWWDALFDRVVLNSALVTAPRHRLLKLLWYALTSATLATYGYLIAWNLVIALAALWLPLFLVLLLEIGLVNLLAGPRRAREQAILEQLRADLDRLSGKHRGITLEYPAVQEVVDDDGKPATKDRKGVAQIRVELDGTDELDPAVRDEIVRLLWHSRLYPLDEIWFGERYTTITLGTAQLGGAEAERLRHRHGPRPYGPYPKS
ncbi:DUF1707 domain-containing protein [Dactylosporangium sp. NPDC005572]|uniref:DUF1707 domain-containing protein n=1 Tax=Dactylosporangium sp. NPDC005572 TaxID=3156889 RepID=UPI0033B92968